MTNCFPAIITSRLCPREELEFSNTPPTCVRVVPVYNDSIYVISQFPPPVHFLVTDDGTVYHLAPIQSPPATPPEYHALLDSSGCILVGVEFSSVTNSPITTAQVSALPGALRYVLTTLTLPLSSVTSELPTPRCRRQLWNEILDDTADCLNEPPPPPPPPPSLSCAFVLGCLSAGQNINITGGGNIRAGQLVQGPNPGEYTWVTPSGTPSFSFSPGGSIAVADTTTIDMTLAAGPTISANVIVSPAPNNQLQITAQGLYVPPIPLNVNDTLTVDLSLVGGVLTADVIVSPAAGNQLQVTAQGLYVPPGTASPCFSTAPVVSTIPANGAMTIFNTVTSCLEQLNLEASAVVYGHFGGIGRPHTQNLFFSPIRNVLWVTDNTTSFTGVLDNTFLIAQTGTSVTIDAYQLIGAIGNSTVGISRLSLISVFGASNLNTFSSVVVGSEFTSVGVTRSLLCIQNGTINNLDNSMLAVEQSTVSGIVNSSTGVIYSSTANSIYRSYVSIFNETTASQIYESAFWGSEDTFGVNSQISRSVINSSSTSFGNASVTRSFAILNDSTLSDSIYTNSLILNNESSIGNVENSVLVLHRLPQNPIVQTSLLINSEVVGLPPARIGPSNPFVNNAVVVSVNSIPNIFVGFLASAQNVPFRQFERTIFAASDFTFADPNPPNNDVEVFNSVIVGQNLNFDPNSILVNNKLVVGTGLTVGTGTFLAIGRGNVVTPAQLAVGGFTTVVGDGSSDNFFESWGNGAWRYRNNGVFANTASAVAALNATYGVDPRVALGTIVHAVVAGTPALFAWNGASFVRITV